MSFGLSKPKVFIHAGTRRHVHRDGDIEHRTRFRSLVPAVTLANKTAEPKVLTANVVHVGHVIREFRVMRRPKSRRVARDAVHAFLAHIQFAGRHVDVMAEHLPPVRLHEHGRRTHAAKRQKTVQGICGWRQGEIVQCRLPFRFGRILGLGFIRIFRCRSNVCRSALLRPRNAERRKAKGKQTRRGFMSKLPKKQQS